MRELQKNVFTQTFGEQVASSTINDDMPLLLVTRMKYTQPNIISLHIFVIIQHNQQQVIHTFCITDTSYEQTSQSL